jgi:4-amino-4-deoxychorismate lyase
VLVNGQACEKISSLDRGLLYGDGVFETIAIGDGVPLAWDLHLARLLRGCARLAITGLDTQALAAEAHELCRGGDRGIVKVMVTRGIGQRGYRPEAGVMPTRIVQWHPWPKYPSGHWRDGVNLRWCQTRLAVQPLLAGIKHLNRLEQVLARAEWDEPRIAEGLMCDTRGRVVSGTMSNVFFVADGVLHTPDIRDCGVAGVARARILQWADQERLACRIDDYTPAALQAAKEVFVCNSVIGVWPVRSLDQVCYAPGALAARIMEALFPLARQAALCRL